MRQYRKTLPFRPSVEQLETILCLDAGVPVVVQPLVQPTDVPSLETSPPAGLSPTGNVQTGQNLVDMTVTSFQAVSDTFQQGTQNLVDNLNNTICALYGPQLDPAPGPVTLTPPVQVVPDPLGPIALAPVLPYATPTDPVPAPETMACLPNSCSIDMTIMSTAPYTVAIAVPVYYNNGQAFA